MAPRRRRPVKRGVRQQPASTGAAAAAKPEATEPPQNYGDGFPAESQRANRPKVARKEGFTKKKKGDSTSKSDATKQDREQSNGSRRPQTMSRILLVDDSPHAQRIGERILTEEGFEVVTVSNADAALIRIEDVDPDVVIADTVMPGRTGYEICQYLKMNPRHRHVRVILTAGVLEADGRGPRCRRLRRMASLKKPFEATALVNVVRPLAEAAARRARTGAGGQGRGSGAPRLRAARCAVRGGGG